MIGKNRYLFQWLISQANGIGQAMIRGILFWGWAGGAGAVTGIGAEMLIRLVNGIHRQAQRWSIARSDN